MHDAHQVAQTITKVALLWSSNRTATGLPSKLRPVNSGKRPPIVSPESVGVPAGGQFRKLPLVVVWR